MREAGTREWPLAVFTVLLQLSCGLSLAATVSDWSAIQPAPMRPLGLAVFPVVVVAAGASLLHVGRPPSAWRLLANAARSRLSHEILLTGVFAVLALIYSASWLGGPTGTRHAVGAITTGFGLLAVAASARIYLLPNQPFWNAAWLPVSFAGTTLLLGGCAGRMVAIDSARASGLFLGGIVAGSVLVCVAAVGMAARWSRLLRCEHTEPQLEIERRRTPWWSWLAFGAHVSLAGAVPLALAIAGGPQPWAVFGCVLLGAVLGRTLMYSLPASLSRF